MAIARTASLCTNRFYSSATADIAAEIQTRGPWYYHEPLAMAQINKLHTSFTGYIPQLNDAELAAGASLPLGYHLAFFNDVSPETELAGDGYHTAQAPSDEAKFPARMWLGGSVEFNPHAKHGDLTIGAPASAKELIKATSHSQKKINPDTTVERLDVTLDRLLYGADLVPADMDATNWALRETRSIAYFSPEAGASRKDTFTRHIKRK
jgi:hydroxyacyl-ACP dehydratase HTD2-like protein with hotdog domain